MDEILEIVGKAKPLLDILVEKDKVEKNVPYSVSFDFILKNDGAVEEKDNQYVFARLRLVKNKKK